jgi:hypothetical protein
MVQCSAMVRWSSATYQQIATVGVRQVCLCMYVRARSQRDTATLQKQGRKEQVELQRYMCTILVLTMSTQGPAYSLVWFSSTG